MKSRGLVVETEDSQLRGLGFKLLTKDIIFHAPFIWIKAWNKRTLHCSMGCIPANKGADFDNGWLMGKIQLHLLG
jgi:hypothetical protein